MKCINCDNIEAVKYSKYSNGKFCSRKCARSFSSKDKREEISIKVSKKLKGRQNTYEQRLKVSGSNNGRFKKGDYTKNIEKLISKNVDIICSTCKIIFTVPWKEKNRIFCTIKCKNINEELRKNNSIKMQEFCSSPLQRKRLRDVGRKGGFGKKGYTESGIYYQSTLEKNAFELLESLNINFIPHKAIPNSSKISDIFLIDSKVWIELDGIDREKKKRWLGKDYDYWLEKLRIYQDNNLVFVIIKSIKELKNYFKI